MLQNFKFLLSVCGLVIFWYVLSVYIWLYILTFCMGKHVCVFRPEVDIGFLPWLLYVLYIEAESHD